MNIVILHGAIGSKEQMSSLTKLLSPEHQVFSYDFPGHGELPAYEQEFSIEVFENWISEKINSLNGEIGIIGYSLGGYVALRLALKNPKRIKAVLTFGTIFAWSKEQSKKQIAMINPEKLKEKVPAFAAQLEKTHGSKWEQVLKQTHTLLEKLGDNPLLNDDNLKLIEAKCIITVGDRDALVSIEESFHTYKLIPNAQFAVYPKTGHPIENAPHHKMTKDFLDLLK